MGDKPGEYDDDFFFLGIFWAMTLFSLLSDKDVCCRIDKISLKLENSSYSCMANTYNSFNVSRRVDSGAALGFVEDLPSEFRNRFCLCSGK